ncbi:hypothetical protein HYW21_02390 [Candidatus Woesearchaeota archaeon]|nr:hypothetical protein [Candidatus Woesearchaeota archaeon]
MTTLTKLAKDIAEVKERNRRVEADKAWETSWTRKVIIAILTYLVMVVLFITVKLPEPWLNALVPTTAFFVSTLTLPLCKKWWLHQR